MKTRTVEWLLASLMVAWGVALGLPGDMFPVGEHYRFLSAIATEPVWAAFSFSIGAARLTALYINGSWRRTPAIRIIGAVFGLVWWITLGGLYGLAVMAGARAFPALAFFPVFVFFEALSCYRSGLDAHESGAFKPRPKRGGENASSVG